MCLCPGSGLKQLLERWVTASSGMAFVFAGVERPFSFYEERLLCFLRPLPDQPNGAGARSAAASCRGQAPLDLRLFRQRVRVDRRASAGGSALVCHRRSSIWTNGRASRTHRGSGAQTLERLLHGRAGLRNRTRRALKQKPPSVALPDSFRSIQTNKRHNYPNSFDLLAFSSVDRVGCRALQRERRRPGGCWGSTEQGGAGVCGSRCGRCWSASWGVLPGCRGL
jgi:hypothetical protein